MHMGVDLARGKDAAYITISGKSFPIVSYEIEYSGANEGHIRAEAAMITSFVPNRGLGVEFNAGVACDEVYDKLNDIIGENEMGRCGDETTACADSSVTLAERAAKLDLDEDKRLLIEAGVIYDDGTITRDGEKLLAQVLLNENKDKVVAKVKAIKEAEKEEK